MIPLNKNIMISSTATNFSSQTPVRKNANGIDKIEIIPKNPLINNIWSLTTNRILICIFRITLIAPYDSKKTLLSFQIFLRLAFHGYTPPFQHSTYLENLDTTS